ncbi:MAG: hypothetical protein LBB63_02405 [Holosporaceae bacterium]|jgi:hypothetical protein|nr:hypothetical protein [Holosporaceae bacterium]
MNYRMTDEKIPLRHEELNSRPTGGGSSVLTAIKNDLKLLNRKAALLNQALGELLSGTRPSISRSY